MSTARPNAQGRVLRRVSAIVDALEEYLGKPFPQKRRARPLDSLIATLLSQNTNDRNSYRAWLNLKKKYPAWDRVHRASWCAIAQAIEIGGLKNQKAQRIKLILQALIRQRGALDLDFLKKMSDDEAMEYLLAMKGVGNKTAACVLVFSLGRDVFPVDTHIHRICNRLGIVKTTSADETFVAMKPLVPPGKGYSFHVNLIHFGRQRCKASNPGCSECILYEECIYPQKGRHQASMSTLKHGQRDFLITERISHGSSRRATSE